PEHRIFRPAPPRAFQVARAEEGSFRVTGEGVERLIARYDLDNEDALAHLEGRLRALGVIRALGAAGFQAGDDVEIGGVVFDLDP
ncbi:MAG: Obg family GTPase CgtA, partial [Solirubrobacteraceae bacterium]